MAIATLACNEETVQAPRVPPAPAIAVQALQPRFPPPEPRDTKVLPLDSKSCPLSDTTLVDFTLAEVLARCETTGPTSRVFLTVVPRTTDPADHLRTLSLRFCGDVVGAEGPTGWKVEIQREKGRSAVAADVTWTIPDAPARPEISASRRIGAFTVILRGQWRRGWGYHVGFSESFGLSSIAIHDCPYPFR